MPLRLPDFTAIPQPAKGSELLEVPVRTLRPTQWCVGFAEVWARQSDFAQETRHQRMEYLRSRPVPLVRSKGGDLWMIDRHHRLRGLLEIEPLATTTGYLVADGVGSEPEDGYGEILTYLAIRGWLYLYDGRGCGPRDAEDLPESLLDLEDDPYRSLVWKLKKEGLIRPQAQIPYHEFRWGAWLRSRPLPPFSSRRLEPALTPARRLVCSQAASSMAGWKGNKRSCE